LLGNNGGSGFTRSSSREISREPWTLRPSILTAGWVVVAVWESKAIWEKFRDETLLPAFQAGQSVLPGPPTTTEFEVEVEL
jgi:hypothetical protein